MLAVSPSQIHTSIMSYLSSRARQAKLPQRVLAEELGTQQSNISELLTGQVHNPGLITLIRLFRATKVRATLTFWRGLQPDVQVEIGHVGQVPTPQLSVHQVPPPQWSYGSIKYTIMKPRPLPPEKFHLSAAAHYRARQRTA
jgi:predicted XRE-type DNA-binding protein